MMLLFWLTGGVGFGLIYSGYQGINPGELFRALLTGKPLPARNSWRPVGGTSGSSTTGRTGSKPTGGGSVSVNDWVFGDDDSPGTTGKNEMVARMVVVEWAKTQLGKRYVFGAAGPNEYDCSGLTMRAYEQVGIQLPHNAAMQQLRGKQTFSPLPADLVFWGAVSGHCAIYLGNGQILHAPQAGDVVKISSTWDEDIISYRSYF